MSHEPSAAPGEAASASPDLNRQLVSGIAWTAGTRWLGQLVSWAATLYVARILVPGDYGVVAMATAPIGLLRMVEDFGLDAVLIQDRSIDGDRQGRLAGLAVLLGASFTLILSALAVPIAGFFKEPAVAPAITGMSLLFVLDALQIVPRAALQRQLEYRRLAILFLVQLCVTSATIVVAARDRKSVV